MIKFVECQSAGANLVGIRCCWLAAITNVSDRLVAIAIDHVYLSSARASASVLCGRGEAGYSLILRKGLGMRLGEVILSLLLKKQLQDI